MDDMIRFGPSKYDVAVVYESLAISNSRTARGGGAIYASTTRP
jgi:predicted outer membrane repeat protein